jgi:UDP-N-acetylmuramoyl-tripeptide--D-alanyl-D-alanine ligase
MNTARRLRQDLFTFGLEPHNDVTAERIRENPMKGISFILRYRDGSWPVNLKVPGRHNMQNALAAAAVGFVSNVSPEHIVAGLEEFKGITGRFTIERLSCGVTVIDDTYNANPTALRAALETGKSMIPKTSRFLVALGDMLELGDAAPMEHRAAGRLVADAGAAYFIVMGDYAPDMIRGAIEAGFPENHIAVVQSHDQMVEALEGMAGEGDIVFFKASRLMALDKAVEMFKASMERKRTADAL